MQVVLYALEACSAFSIISAVFNLVLFWLYRHQACLTLSSLVNGSSEVGSVAIEHYAVDKLLSILKDERDLLTLARPHVAVCLHSLSRDNKSVLQTIAEANVIPRYVWAEET